MGASWRPDIVVGVDFGMTSTGVAYSMAPEWPEPKTMQHWPGRLGHELRNKVDTAVAYDLKTAQPSRWGFLCDPDDEEYEYNELFKLFLDPKYEDTSGLAPSIQQAQQWFHDFLQFLHGYIHRTFKESMPRYETKRVEYVFSVPTTWKSPALIAAMEGLIRSAGFGQSNRERASIYLTEAEAAAVYATHAMKQDEVFIVCDAGGGTTDLNVLKVASTTRGQLELSPLSWTEGIAVGSTLIDFKARNVLIERLRLIEDQIEGDLESIVTKLINDQFTTFKCSFGHEGLDVPKLSLLIPGLAPGRDFPEIGVENSRISITNDDLRAIFDEQIAKMFGLIDQQLQIVQSSHSHEDISYLILSGGLSSSPYVQKQARARYEFGGNLRLSNTNDLRVIIAQEPQLAVVHGLVIARSQMYKSGLEIFTKRCCPVSYGLLCREKYNPDRHQGEEIVVDEYKPEIKWAAGQIEWVIRRGDIFNSAEGYKQKYRHKIPLQRWQEPQHLTIMMSNHNSWQLPRSIKHSGADLVCMVHFTLDQSDLKLKNDHWYSVGKRYYVAEYEVRAIPGAGLRFEVWGRNGRKSRDHEDIDVDWQPVGDGGRASRMSPETYGDSGTMYRSTESW